MASLTLHATPLAGLMVVETTPVGDARGCFARLFCARELAPLRLPGPIAQVNHSFTAAKGTVRGMHFQRPPKAEAKLIRCLKGRVLDVAVDLRKGSPTFLKWHAVELSPENRLAFYLPQGFAHGFQTLEADCELLYLHTEFYSPEHEGGIRFDDPELGIAWPLPAAEPSARDRAHPLLGPDFAPLET
ncbi:MAG: dTDP-4-dehydrorhamnose 3,5-epimerase [Humidesulfovibrio sp.]|uniref:dTDP-4-dehydrorhamnose 3,5-epimerase n=1 Tax=Humidesulfovibrio sp. TaxID=2910988 RepID=UPI002732F5DB|nr:dTDP-4-dehydrorhamnose 3,5-epimerase [Humidesulfovibrio sp.]MDP2847062.1 dTDP-4-dehydrorhamnose 3,5-epimerase [Humidesulfovibrio sp.]